MKKLYAFGDSYTDNYYSNLGFDFSFPKWPEIVANQLGMDLCNAGRSNASNYEIIQKALMALVTEKDIGVIMILLSSITRTTIGHETIKASDTPQKQHYSLTDFDPEEKRKYEENLTNANVSLQNLFETKNDLVMDGCVDTCIKQIIYMQKICEKFKIPLIIGSAFGGCDASRPAVKHDVKETWAYYYHEHISIDKINTDNIIGWPFLPELGGFNMDSYIKETLGPDGDRVYNADRTKYDGHPSAIGHKAIANLFYQKYKDIYLYK